MQVSLALKALGVNFVNLFGARRTRREPSAFRDHLDSADRRSVAGRDRQGVENFLARELARIQFLGRQVLQNFLLREGCGRVDTFVGGLTELAGQVIVYRAGVAPFPRGHLGGEQTEDESVLVSRPETVVGAKKRPARAFLAAESDRAVDEPVHEPLEADRSLDQLALEARRDTIDHAAAQ